MLFKQPHLLTAFMFFIIITIFLKNVNSMFYEHLGNTEFRSDKKRRKVLF